MARSWGLYGTLRVSKNLMPCTATPLVPKVFRPRKRHRWLRIILLFWPDVRHNLMMDTFPVVQFSPRMSTTICRTSSTSSGFPMRPFG